jgi:hypothetical protein
MLERKLSYCSRVEYHPGVVYCDQEAPGIGAQEPCRASHRSSVLEIHSSWSCVPACPILVLKLYCFSGHRVGMAFLFMLAAGSQPSPSAPRLFPPDASGYMCTVRALAV